MKNLLSDKPGTNDSGLACVQAFVQEADLIGKDLLDIGCGFGWFERMALDAGVRSIIGVEPKEQDLKTVRRHLIDERAAFQVASVISMPFANDSFDTVVMWEVLEHIPKSTEAVALAEIARILRPGGALYLSTPHNSLVAKLTDPAWWFAGHRHYSVGDIERFSRAAGLRVEAIERKGGLPQILYMLNLYVAKWVFRRRPFFQQSSLRLVKKDWTKPSGFTQVFLRARRGPA